MIIDIITSISVLSTMFLLRSLVNIFPSLAACLTRAKESFNLEASVKLSRDRDMLAIAMILPFCLTVLRFNLCGEGLTDSFGEGLEFAVILGSFCLYILFRYAVYRLFGPQRIPQKTYRIAGKAAHTFFIILTLILLAAGGTMSFIGTEEEAIKSAILCISAGIYALFLLRKFQIFLSSCSVFTAFLYLCALEIIPTGTLLVTAIIL